MTTYKPKILIVDDTNTNLYIMKKILSSMDAEIFLANSGEVALALTLRHTFSVILLDVQMPEMDGFETATLIRAYVETKFIPIIFVTALHKETSFIMRGYKAGAVDYLFKPVDRNILISKVKVFLDLDRQRNDLQIAMCNIRELGRQKELLLECAGEGIIGTFSDGRVSFMNPAALNMLGLKKDQISDLTIDELLLDPDDRLGPYPHGWNAVKTRENRMTNAAGDHFPIVFSSSLIVQKGDVTGGVLAFLDITERKQAEMKLIELANFDQLTHLANRTMFQVELEKMIARNRRKNGVAAIMFLDLDNFKSINDSYGHDAGDEVLKTVAKRLTSVVRDYDLVARLAGDEFGILLEGLETPSDLAAVGNKILKCMRPAVPIANRNLFLTCSIGIATYPKSGEDPTTLIKAADIAMYEAKKDGRDAVKFFDLHMQEQVRERMDLERDLRKAVDNQQLEVYFQPQVDSNQKIRGMEALLRWNHPEKGCISPAAFIPIAEETGVIVPIGQWVMEQACSRASEWFEDYGESAPRIAVNVSPRQFKGDQLVDVVNNALAASNLPPDRLEIEITESTIMEDANHIIQQLQQFRQKGIHIALDDFGTGYSSLSYLTRLPVDVVKIDHSFVTRIGSDTNSELIIKGILSLAGSMHLDVVAEGVETTKHLNFFKDQKCDLFQGYFFHKPMTANHANQLISKHHTSELQRQPA